MAIKIIKLLIFSFFCIGITFAFLGPIDSAFSQTPPLDNEDSLDVFKSIATKAIESNQATLARIEDSWIRVSIILGIMGGTATLAIGTLAFYEIRKSGDLNKRTEEKIQALNSKEAEAALAITALRLSFTTLRKTFFAFDIMKQAFRHRDASESDWKNQHQHIRNALQSAIRAKKLVEGTLTDEKMIVEHGDPGVMGWAYQVLGVSTGEISKLNGCEEDYPKALEMLEKGVELMPGSAAGHYNAACYASLLHDVGRALKHLDMAVNLDGRYIESAIKDPDLASCKGTPEYRSIIRQESWISSSSPSKFRFPPYRVFYTKT